MKFCDLFKEFIPIRVDEDIYLRQHEPEKDARPFWEIYYDEENFTYFGGYKRPHDWNAEREIQIEASRVKGFKGKREYPWVVTYQGKVIGQIQLFHFFNHNTCAEVGYFIKKTYWNRGINTKVLKAVCRFGIETMGLERIEAFAHVDNIGSNRTLQKAGFVKEGTLRKRLEIKGELHDCNVYSFVKDNLENIQGFNSTGIRLHVNMEIPAAKEPYENCGFQEDGRALLTEKDNSDRKETEPMPSKKYMPPLWLVYPWISQFSIGWRMGVGEDYKYKLWDWLDTLPEQELAEWEKLFPQPAFWQDLDDEEEEEPENGILWYSNEEHIVNFWRERGVPMLDIAALQKRHQAGGKMDFCFFWGGKKKADIGPECFSQWYPSEFSCDTDDYICMEQYMMAEKARLFGDKEICAKIMESTEPNKIKALGRKVKNFDQAVWDACKYSIVLNGNYLKFIQNPKLKEFLLSTGDKVLVEASPYDGIWGIRMGEKSPNVRNPTEWQGENLLGFALMEVREELRRVCANEKLIDWKTVEN